MRWSLEGGIGSELEHHVMGKGIKEIDSCSVVEMGNSQSSSRLSKKQRA